MKNKPKILSPTLRLKKRYIAFQVVAENNEKFTFDEIANAIWHALAEFAGEINVALSRIWVMKDLWEEEKMIGVIKCSHTAVELVRSAIILIDRIGDTRVAFLILGVSGTVKGVRKKFIEQKTLQEFD